jgi:hypothetical protein
MICAKCGTTTAENDRCAVCDPWAVPAAFSTGTGTRSDASMAPPTMVPASVPKWLARLIKKNPPAAADLDAALRMSILVWCASGIFFAALGTTIIALSAGGVPTVPVLILFVAGLGAVAVGLVARRRTWLPRAVAAVGARPDIGYLWLARVPQLVLLNKVNQFARFAVIIIIVLRNAAAAGPVQIRVALAAVYVLAFVGIFTATVVLEVGAGKIVRARLAAPPTAPVPGTVTGQPYGVVPLGY